MAKLKDITSLVSVGGIIFLLWKGAGYIDHFIGNDKNIDVAKYQNAYDEIYNSDRSYYIDRNASKPDLNILDNVIEETPDYTKYGTENAGVKIYKESPITEEGLKNSMEEFEKNNPWVLLPDGQIKRKSAISPAYAPPSKSKYSSTKTNSNTVSILKSPVEQTHNFSKFGTENAGIKIYKNSPITQEGLDNSMKIAGIRMLKSS